MECQQCESKRGVKREGVDVLCSRCWNASRDFERKTGAIVGTTADGRTATIAITEHITE